jgi:Protein of unknown function (DUF3309)
MIALPSEWRGVAERRSQGTFTAANHYLSDIETGICMSTLLIIILLVLLLGGGGFGYSRYGMGGAGGALGLVLVIILVLYLLGMIGGVR